MFDFIRCAREHHIPILEEGHHHCHQGWVQTHCPRCSGGVGGWHLGFGLSSGAFNCWRCGRLELREVLSFFLPSHSIGKLINTFSTAGVQAPMPPKSQTRKRILTLPPDTKFLERPHREYLLSRNFDPDVLVATWFIAGIGPLGGRWAWR